MTFFTPALPNKHAVVSLAERVAAGDKSDIAARRILTDASVLGWSAGESDELTQAAAVRLWECRGTLAGKTIGYARQFARSRMLNDLRAGRRYTAHIESEIDAADDAESLSSAERIADHTHDPAHNENTSDILAAIEAAAAESNNPARSLAVVNALRRGYRPVEIASKLGVTEGTVSKIISALRASASARVQF